MGSYCAGCGSQIDDDARFCGDCGKDEAPAVNDGAFGLFQTVPHIAPPRPIPLYSVR